MIDLSPQNNAFYIVGLGKSGLATAGLACGGGKDPVWDDRHIPDDFKPLCPKP